MHREKTGKMQKKLPCQGKNREFEKNLPKHRENTGNFVCSSCKFPDSKVKEYCDICHKNFQFSFQKLDWSGKSVLCIIATNYVNWHRDNLRLDRVKTGKTQGI